jgi:hypothetical protein
MQKGKNMEAYDGGYFGPIEKQTLKNEYFQEVLYTGKYTSLW